MLREVVMKRGIWLGPVVLVAAASVALTAPLTPHPPLKVELPALASRYFPVSFEGGQRAIAIASGNFSSPLGLYVYDAHGNCVARDEALEFEGRDDLAAEWFPPETAAYTIEVRNAGLQPNPARLVLR
jgi:hypothetical protein